MLFINKDNFMAYSKRRHRKWTKELIIEEAKKYEYRSDFKAAEPNLYRKVIENKWQDECFSHMHFKPSIWVKAKCIEAAKMCEHRSEFCKKYPGAYKSASQNGWLNEIAKTYFTPVGNRAKRCIYAYEFDDKHVYVGLTGNLKRRNAQHMSSNDSAVFNYIKKTNKQPILKQITDYIEAEDASYQEGNVLSNYANSGWTQLNRAKTGGLGTKIERKEKDKKPPKFIWTKELISQEAKKYKTRKEFAENSPSAYAVASRKKILDEVCAHMILLQRRKWTKEEAAAEALKYKERGEFRIKANGCYLVSLRNGWLDGICKHMSNGYDRRKIYNKENVIKTLSKYENMQQLRKSEDIFVRGCYWWLKKNKLLTEYKKYLKHDKTNN